MNQMTDAHRGQCSKHCPGHAVRSFLEDPYEITTNLIRMSQEKSVKCTHLFDTFPDGLYNLAKSSSFLSARGVKQTQLELAHMMTLQNTALCSCSPFWAKQTGDAYKLRPYQTSRLSDCPKS